MQRLFRVRELEEEQARLALEAATGTLRQLEHALEASATEDRRGRRLFDHSAHTGELPDRLGGLEESRAAGRWAAVLAPRIAGSEAEVAALRKQFLEKRIERRQVETLIEETEGRDDLKAGRRSQQTLDDWYGSKKHRNQRASKPANSFASE
jgi:flagellar biosynthesis chaperone FliJ